MMEDRLSESLVGSGFRRVDSNVQGIYLYYRVDENDTKIISVINIMSGAEITANQYEHILKQVKANFAGQGKPIQLLNIFFTNNPTRVRQLCAEAGEDNHWIIDCSTNRLMIYETQISDFYGLKNIIEQLLIEEQNRIILGKDEANYSYDGYLHREGSRQSELQRGIGGFQFTLVNISIVLINTLIFIITQYTPLFGGRRVVMEKGALSWYLITEGGEYYRIITSMFMHSDFSHLFNNMLLLLFIGGILEKVTGKYKYLLIYVGSGIIAGVCSLSYNMLREYKNVPYARTTISVGASGAIFGVVGGILYIVIINKGKLEQINLRQLIFFVILSLYNGFANARIDQAAHIGGFLAGLLLAAIIYRKPNTDNHK